VFLKLGSLRINLALVAVVEENGELVQLTLSGGNKFYLPAESVKAFLAAVDNGLTVDVSSSQPQSKAYVQYLRNGGQETRHSWMDLMEQLIGFYKRIETLPLDSNTRRSAIGEVTRLEELLKL
jgi:hypothetical protein